MEEEEREWKIHLDWRKEKERGKQKKKGEFPQE